MSAPVSLSLSEARWVALQTQGLGRPWRLPAGKEGAAQVIERLGFVQIDTIAVIERAHHHTFWVRRPDYRPAMLETLLAEDRRVFEYWAAPAAAYVPMCDYRWYLPRMLASRQSNWRSNFEKKHPGLLRAVLQRIEQEGPLGTSDFEAPPGTKRGKWWDWKPAKEALELLYNGGELMISSRPKFQRRYDLAERILPQHIDRRVPTLEEARAFAVRRYLTSHGIVAERDFRVPAHRAVLKELVAAGAVVTVQIEGVATPHYALPASLKAALRSGSTQRSLHILSPFDSMAGNRHRLRRLFNFDYTIECYVPGPKRKYGYFCLPIVWGDRFIGRLDSKAERAEKRYVVHQLYLEPDVVVDEALLTALRTRLQDFAAFNGCDHVEVRATSPRSLRKALGGRILA